MARSPADGPEAPRVSGLRYPTWHPDEIADGLFMGGTSDTDTVFHAGRPGRIGEERPFDAVVTLYAWAQPMSWEVEELRYGFGDAALTDAGVARLLRAAAWAHARWTAGDRVLIRCQAGLNRAGLVTALVLMLDGLTAAEAIALMRSRRSQHVLFNASFVQWLELRAPELLASGG